MSKVCSIDVEEAKKLHIDSSSEEEEDNSEDGITKASEYQIPEDGVGHFSQASNCSSGHANPSILARTAYLKQRQIMLKSSKKEVYENKTMKSPTRRLSLITGVKLGLGLANRTPKSSASDIKDLEEEVSVASIRDRTLSDESESINCSNKTTNINNSSSNHDITFLDSSFYDNTFLNNSNDCENEICTPIPEEAPEITEKRLAIHKELFEAFDLNKYGELEIDEIAKSLGFDKTAAENIVRINDSDCNDTIDLLEFSAVKYGLSIFGIWRLFCDNFYM